MKTVLIQSQSTVTIYSLIFYFVLYIKKSNLNFGEVVDAF